MERYQCDNLGLSEVRRSGETAIFFSGYISKPEACFMLACGLGRELGKHF